MARTNEIAKLRAELEAMGERLMALTEESADDMSDSVTSYVNQASRMAKEGWNKAKDLSGQAGARAQEYAEENPWQMLAAGAALGFLIGYIVRNHD